MASSFRPSAFIRAKKPSEVCNLLEKYGDRALIIGGGTLIHSLATRGVLSQVEALIDIRDLRLNYVNAGSNGLEIGATTTFAEVERNDQIRRNPAFGALKDALEYPPIQIRNTATIAGSVASSFPLFDIPIALLAIGTSVSMTKQAAQREIKLEELFRDYFQTSLDSGEFITEVLLAPPSGAASAFLKLETNANDLAIVNLAVRMSVDSNNRCNEARIFVGGGVGKVPVRASSSEKKLTNKTLSQSAIEEAAQAIEADVQPVSDHRASSRYRTAVTKVLLKRAVRSAVERKKNESGVSRG